MQNVLNVPALGKVATCDTHGRCAHLYIAGLLVCGLCLAEENSCEACGGLDEQCPRCRD